MFKTLYRPAMPFGNRKKYFKGSFQLKIVTIQKILPPGNLKFNYLGIFQSFKLRISMEKINSVSLQLNFAPNTLGSNGLSSRLSQVLPDVKTIKISSITSFQSMCFLYCIWTIQNANYLQSQNIRTFLLSATKDSFRAGKENVLEVGTDVRSPNDYSYSTLLVLSAI